MVGAHRRDIAAGGREPVNHNHQRLRGCDPAQHLVQLLGAGRGAARRVDMHDDGLGARFGQFFERLNPLLIVADQAGNPHPRDVVAAGSQNIAAPRRNGESFRCEP